jgi:ubiquinone/menaquinone biosynthesis C-methylase UbiE
MTDVSRPATISSGQADRFLDRPLPIAVAVVSIHHVFSELFANNVFVKLLRGDASRYDLIVSMVGVKLGERLVVIAGGDGALVAALGGKTGLTGTVVAVEPDKPRAERVLTEATKAGVLADAYASPELHIPFDANAFDIAVIPFPADDGDSLSVAISEAFRVLRDGGRCAVIARATGAAGAATNASAPAAGASPIIARLHQQGFKAARVLAERKGLTFYEAVKK